MPVAAGDMVGPWLERQDKHVAAGAYGDVCYQVPGVCVRHEAFSCHTPSFFHRAYLNKREQCAARGTCRTPVLHSSLVFAFVVVVVLVLVLALVRVVFSRTETAPTGLFLPMKYRQFRARKTEYWRAIWTVGGTLSYRSYFFSAVCVFFLLRGFVFFRTTIDILLYDDTLRTWNVRVDVCNQHPRARS